MRIIWRAAVAVVCAASILYASSEAHAQNPGMFKVPKGAKAIFDSGEGPAVGASVAPTQRTGDAAPVVSKQKYVGISYELLLLSDDGQIKKVSSNRTFKSGERIVMRVMTNRPGNLKIYNIGPTGNTNVLFDDFVEGYTMTQVPRSSNFRFVGDPGTEQLLIMLSDGGAPAGGPVVAGGGQPPLPPGGGSDVALPVTNTPYGVPPPPSSGTPSSLPPAPGYGSTPPPPTGSYGSGDMGSVPPPPPAAMVASNIEGSKRIKGGKDIVVEDKMQSSFAVVSPRNKWKPVKSGTKDIVLEQSNGTNYGAVPVSALGEGGILSLTVKLKHR